MKAAVDETVADYIAAALAPCQFEGLLSRRNVADICSSEGCSLPAASTSLFGFECRLGEHEPVADFLVRIGVEPHEWLALEHDVPLRTGDAWRRIEALLTERAKGHSPLREKLQNIWLEYDLVHSTNGGSEPSVFFGTNHLKNKAETGWAADLVAMLRGKALSDASLNAFNRLVAALPDDARVFQVGVMCSRPRAPLRICVIGQEWNETLDFLAAIHWPGELSKVSAVMEQYAGIVDRVALDFDLLEDGRFAPRLGIELYQNSDKDLGIRMAEFVTRLQNNGLCVAQKAMGLFAWGGITHERLYRDIWPASLVNQRILRGNESSTFCRWLHHIKIAVEPDAASTAKAYLAVSHVFLADSAIREILNQMI